jgi:hypothetical protein
VFCGRLWLAAVIVLRPEEEVIQTFQLRRRRARRIGWPLALLGFVVGALTIGREGGGLFPIGFGMAVAGLGVVFYNERCPACGKPPLVWDGSEWQRVSDPLECTNPKCRAQLR